MIGASPSDSSSASSSFGSRPSARASDSICCSPPEQRPARRSIDPLERGEVGEGDRGGHAGQLEVVGDGHVHDHRSLLGEVAEAVPAACVHRCGGRRAEEPDLALHRLQLAGEREQRRRLAGAVRARAARRPRRRRRGCRGRGRPPSCRSRPTARGLDECVVGSPSMVPRRRPVRRQRTDRHGLASVRPLDLVDVAEVGVAHRRVDADLDWADRSRSRCRSRSPRRGRTSTSRGSRRARRGARPCCARRPAAG